MEQVGTVHVAAHHKLMEAKYGKEAAMVAAALGSLTVIMLTFGKEDSRGEAMAEAIAVIGVAHRMGCHDITGYSDANRKDKEEWVMKVMGMGAAELAADIAGKAADIINKAKEG